MIFSSLYSSMKRFARFPLISCRVASLPQLSQHLLVRLLKAVVESGAGDVRSHSDWLPFQAVCGDLQDVEMRVGGREGESVFP
jgi:hypothetical protein